MLGTGWLKVGAIRDVQDLRDDQDEKEMILHWARPSRQSPYREQSPAPGWIWDPLKSLWSTSRESTSYYREQLET